MADRIQHRRDTKANWASANPVLLDGEIGYVTDDHSLYKIGDGIHAWNSLPFHGFDGTIVQTNGDSEIAVMSQKATTDFVGRKVVAAFPGMSLSGTPYVDKNHVINVPSGGAGAITYLSSENYDIAWVYLPEGANVLSISGVVITRVVFLEDVFSDENISSSTSLENNIPNGARFAAINIKHSDNPDGYNIVVDNEKVYDFSKLIESFRGASEGYYIDKNHMCNVSSNNAFTSYIQSNNYDAAIVPIEALDEKIVINGCTHRLINYFADNNISVDSSLATNSTGVIPAGAKMAVINIRHSDNENGYHLRVEHVKSGLKNVPTTKNLLNPNEFLLGYSISSGQVVETENGMMSNKIYLEHGKTYTAQGIICYGDPVKIFYARYTDKDEFIDRVALDCINEEGSSYGSATFTFDDKGGFCSYVRFCVQNSRTFSEEIAQIELGDEATEVVAYKGKDVMIEKTPRKSVKILSIGNSYSYNYLAYVPYIMKSLCKDVDITIGVLYKSGATLEDHYNNFINDTYEYKYTKYVGGNFAWNASVNDATIADGLNDEQWDIIMLQQGSVAAWDADSYQPYLNDLISDILDSVSYPVKFGWFSVMSRPKYSNIIVSDANIEAHANSIIANANTVLSTTPIDFVVPMTIAIQNARLTSLNSLGEFGKLCSSDGGHLQSGLPCQLAAYVTSLKIAEVLGIKHRGILGSKLKMDSTFLANANAPQNNGPITGYGSIANLKIAQYCAVMAIKRPDEVTDVTSLL